MDISTEIDLIKTLKGGMSDVGFFLPPNVLNLLETITSGLVVLNKDRKILFMNKTARDLLQYDLDEVIGCRCRKIVNNKYCNTEDCPITRSLNENSHSMPQETYYRGKKGQIVHAKTHALILRDERGEVSGSIEVFNDISLIKALEEELDGRASFGNIIGKSHQMQEIYKLIEEVAPTTSSILITGESGTGKELIADAIHRMSRRNSGRHVKVNCGALAEGLLESELFGHVKGAFTGAIADKIGRFQMADKGTIFLDEIGEMNLATQVKLLRVLQEGEFEKVGGTKTIRVDVRVIAATNRNLKKAIAENHFRQDLYYRLNVVNIHIPPLRERKTDIPLLIDFFLRRLKRKMPQKTVESVAPEVLDLLMEYDFPGNVRELENIIEHSFVRCQRKTITVDHLPKEITDTKADIVAMALEDEYPILTIERELLVRLLESHSWSYTNVARKLGISRTTLWRKIRKLGIEKTK
ncbi:MAG: sigma-54 interaction domain-containing protein [Candidatus Glassbacteria bacterium]